MRVRGARCPAPPFRRIPAAVVPVVADVEFFVVVPLDTDELEVGSFPTDKDNSAVVGTVSVLTDSVEAVDLVSILPGIIVTVALGGEDDTEAGFSLFQSRSWSVMSIIWKDMYAPTPKHVSTLPKAIRTLQFASP